MSIEDPRLFIHNQDNSCFEGENRYHEDSLFCWRGRVTSEPCMSASICSPVSYADARSRFCEVYGGSADLRKPGNPTCKPNIIVANLPGEDPITRDIRGGIVVNPQMECQGIAGRFKCFGTGIGQSIHTLPPHELLLRGGIALAGLFIIALMFRHFGGRKLIPKGLFNTKALKPSKRK